MNFFGQTFNISHVPQWLWPLVWFQMFLIVRSLIRSDPEAWLRGMPHLVFKFSRFGRVTLKTYRTVDAPDARAQIAAGARITSADLCCDLTIAWAAFGEVFSNWAPASLRASLRGSMPHALTSLQSDSRLCHRLARLIAPP